MSNSRNFDSCEFNYLYMGGCQMDKWEDLEADEVVDEDLEEEEIEEEEEEEEIEEEEEETENE